MAFTFTTALTYPRRLLASACRSEAPVSRRLPGWADAASCRRVSVLLEERWRPRPRVPSEKQRGLISPVPGAAADPRDLRLGADGAGLSVPSFGLKFPSRQAWVACFGSSTSLRDASGCPLRLHFCFAKSLRPDASPA